MIGFKAGGVTLILEILYLVGPTNWRPWKKLLKKQLIMKWEFMKNVWLYQLIANTTTAIFLIFWFERGQPIIPLLVYAVVDPFIIRPFLDFQRLKALGKVEDKDFWKMWKWGGLYRFKYYNTLMFGK